MPRKLLTLVLLFAILSLLPIGCTSISNGIQEISGSPAVLGSQGISVGIPPMFSNNWAAAIYVSLKPTSHAVAGQTYTVDLYEKGKLRSTSTVSFTQPDINVQNEKMIAFPATYDEYNAYFMKDVSNIFSVKVHEPIVSTASNTTESVLINPNQEPTLTITSPNGGGVWHIGETVNITWTSTNLTKDASIAIYLCPNYENGGTALIISGEVANTGTYKWTVNTISELGKSYPVIGSHTRVQLMAKWGYGNVLGSISANDFTISAK
jgi:hypothetical protein